MQNHASRNYLPALSSRYSSAAATMALEFSIKE